MGDQKIALQFNEPSPEESDILKSLYGAKLLRNGARVGPKGYIFTKEHEKFAADIYNMELRTGDIVVASYQRSGTTWTQELVWQVANDLDFKTAESVMLVDRYPFLEQISFIFDEEERNSVIERAGNTEQARRAMEALGTPATKVLADMPSTAQRFMKTHLPMSLLPAKLLDTAKVVYVARDPRDIVVSSYYHGRFFRMLKPDISLKDLWNAFVKDLFILTPYFEHVKEAWALRDHPNMLFLFYEDLSKDLPTAIRRVADFLGKEMTPVQTQRLCDHLSIDSFKNNASVNFEFLREFGLVDSNETFIRNGKTGGWRNQFDEEMRRDAEQWIADNLRDTDLRFPGMEL